MSYERDLTQHSEVVSAMTETMQCRGPDARGFWTSTQAVLGHRRLSVIDLEGGKQPMAVAAQDDDLPVITYTGEVYNYRELKEELIGLGHEFRTTSDTEVVLRAYLEWGEEFAERLNGMYAFAIWDPRTEELLLVRDRMGVKPLFYYPTPDGVLFGSEPKAILAHPDAEAVVDREGLSEIFAILNTPGHAVFRGMHEVVPATVVRFSREGQTTREYWRLESRLHTDDLQTTIDTIRGLLEDIVERQLFADVKVGTLLSGGLDSSVVTALAAQTLHKQGVEEPISAFSVNFKGHEERFNADSLWPDPDLPFAIEVAEHCGAKRVEHIIVELKTEDILDPKVRDQVLRAQDLPISTGDMEYSLYLLCRALKERVTVALSGETSDEIFGGYTWFHDPEAVNGDTFPWHHPWSKLGGMDTLRELGLWDRLGLTEYIKKRYHEALDEVPRLKGETGHEARIREISYLNISRWENFLLDRKDRLSMAAGLEIRVPFADHRLVQYVFNIPWVMKHYDGREKSLLRAAAIDLVPDSVLKRKKASYPSTQDATYVRALHEKVAGLLTEGSPVLQLIPAANIRKLLDRPVDSYRSIGGLWGVRAVMERLVEFNTWVTEYNVRLEL